MSEQPVVILPEPVDPLMLDDVLAVVRRYHGEALQVVSAPGRRGRVIEVYGAELGAMPGQQAVA